MAHAKSILRNERFLALIAAALLAALLIFGLAKAQEASTPATTPTSTEDRKNQQDYLNNQKRYAKGQRDEVKDILREAKNADVTKANDVLTRYEACLNSRDVDVGFDHFWSNMRDCDDINKDIQDEFNDNLRPLRDCESRKRNIEDRRRERKDLNRNLKDLTRNDPAADISGLNGILSQIDAQFTAADQAMAQGCSRDLADTLNDIGQEFDSLFRDYYDLSNEVSEKANTVRRATENKKDFDRNIKKQCEKDMAREFKNFTKEVEKLQKAATIKPEVQEAHAKVTQVYNDMCTVQIQAMQAALDSGDIDAFDDARNSFQELQRDFWDTLNEARNVAGQEQRAKDAQREIDNKTKELANMKREYGRAVKQAGGIENETAKSALSEYETTLAQAREAAAADPDSWWSDYNQTLNDLQNTFWESFQKVQSAADVARWVKDLTRELTDRSRDLKNVKRECPGVATALEGLLAQMRSTLDAAQQLVGSDPEAARDTLQQIDDLRMQWDEASRSCWESKQFDFEIGKIKEGIQQVEKTIKQFLRAKKITQDQAQVCQSFLDSVRTTLGNFKSEPGVDFEEMFGGLEEQGKEACPFVDFDEPQEFDQEYYRKFFKENVQGIDDHDIAVDVFSKINEDLVSKVLQNLLSNPTVVNTILQLTTNKDVAATTLQGISGIDSAEAQQEVLRLKAETLTLKQQLEDTQNQLKIASAGLDKLRGELESYNFYDKASGDEFRGKIEEFVQGAQGLSKAEINKRIQEISKEFEGGKNRDLTRKYEDGVIPFVDTDIDFWATKFIKDAAKYGIVVGTGEGRFKPAALVTVAELITMVFRASGDGEGGDSGLCNGKYRGHWGNKFLSWAEGRGLSIVSKCTDIDRPALRWEVVQVIGEAATGGLLADSVEQCFPDVRASDRGVNNAVCFAKMNDLMTQEKANAYANVNRAEAATIIRRALEKLFGVRFSGEEDRGDDEDRGEDEFDEDEDAEEEDEDSSSLKSGVRKGCWWDNKCTDKVSAQLLDKEQCAALLEMNGVGKGEGGWGADEDDCTPVP